MNHLPGAWVAFGVKGASIERVIVLCDPVNEIVGLADIDFSLRIH
jgi:hypothetical protein